MVFMEDLVGDQVVLSSSSVGGLWAGRTRCFVLTAVLLEQIRMAAAAVVDGSPSGLVSLIPQRSLPVVW